MNKVVRQNKPEINQCICAMEEYLKDFEQTELPLKHHFAHGTYTRELFMPADTYICGKIHRYSCINILAKGKVCVVTEEGRYDIEAPYVFVSGPGVKKALHVLQDSIWITVHPWSGNEDLKEIEEALIVPSYKQLIEERTE